jgi:1-acyl-sn-glycerol-3-phosphate acyltransferase
MNRLAQKCGVETIPVIQAHERNNPDYNYTQKQIIDNYRSLIQRVNDLTSSTPSLGCIIAPEGHRSEDGILKKGESGVINIAKKLQPVMVIPVVTYSDQELERDKVNFGKRINLNIGNIKIYDENSEEMNIDGFMKDLAMAMPPKIRGQYGENELSSDQMVIE